MGFWPFGGVKKQRAAESNKHVREQSLQSDPSENMGGLEKASTDISGNTRSTTRKDQDNKAQRLSKSRVPSYGDQQHSQATPVSVPVSRKHSRTAQPLSEKQLYQQNPTSQNSLGPENFSVVRPPPTLYPRRPEQDSNFARRKSSKRKAEDHAREREVRAMSSSPIPIPRRPSSFYNTGPLQRDTQDIPGGLNRKLKRPTSQVSLPLPEAFPDAGDLSKQHSFKIGIFAAMSPRPTIRYDANPRNTRGKQPQRPNVLARPAIVEEEADADKKRIDDLADDLDAGGLRELMERDRRRRDRKKQQDTARLKRKLERRAERQREEEARKARTEEFVSASASQVQGLGLEAQNPAAPQQERQAGPSGSRGRDDVDPFADPKSQAASPVAIRNPFEDEKDMDVMQEQGSEVEPEPPIPVRSPLRKIRTDKVRQDELPLIATLSPPVSPAPRVTDRQSMSQGSLLNRETTGDIHENASLTGAASDHSSQRLSSWTAFFRSGTRRKLSSSFQGRSTPSEFSNTSRESFMARKQPPPVVTPRTFRRVDSATPQRTMSKFREHLPDFPISPPDSRVQSPEAGVPPIAVSFNQPLTSGKQAGPVLKEADETSYVPSSPIPTGAERPGNKTSMELDVPRSAKPEMILSQSLASVDSEGSWLSGKPLNGRSGASQKLKPSQTSPNRAMPGAFDGGSDALPSPASHASRGVDLGKENDDVSKKDEKWHVGVGRQPTLIRQASRAKSKEGLLNEYSAKEQNDSDEESGEESPDGEDDAPEPEVAVMRAKSVEYKGHARHVSAGSAKLLDVRRSSRQSDYLLSQHASSATHG